MHKIWKTNKTLETYNIYREARHIANMKTFEAKARYFNTLIEKLSDPSLTSKHYWKLIKQLYYMAIKKIWEYHQL